MHLPCNLINQSSYLYNLKCLYANSLHFFPYQVVKIYNESINTVGDSEDCHFSKASLNLQVSYFKEALFLIEEILPQGMMQSLLVLFSFLFLMMTA